MFVLNGVEKQIKTPQEAETGTAKTDQAEDEEYEPLIGAGYNVSTNANRLTAATASDYRPVNTSNRRHSDWRRGQDGDRWLNKERESRNAAAATRHGRQLLSRRRSPTTDDDTG